MRIAETTTTQSTELPSRGILIAGGALFVLGLIAPLFVPLVLITSLSVAWKSALSGALVVGLPEVLMVAAVAVMGKGGYQFVRSRFWAAVNALRNAILDPRAGHLVGVVARADERSTRYFREPQ
jgi:hypothetical protein